MPTTVPDPGPPETLIEWTSLHGPGDAGPDLVVHGDGRAAVSGRFGGGRPVEATLPAERVAALLHSIVDEHGFFDLAPDRLAAEAPAHRGAAVAVHDEVRPGVARAVQ